MTNSIIKIKAVITAISRTKHGVTRINDVVRDVNTVWVEAGEPYPLPYGEYKRRSRLLADLERMLAQLVDEAHAEALKMNSVKDDQMMPKNYGYRPSMRIMTPVERKMFLNFAHDEALEINQKMDTWAQVSDLMVKHTTPYAIDAVHAEALEMDEERDHEIALRMNAAHDTSWRELSTPGKFEELPTSGMKLKAVNAAHVEAMEDDAKYHVAIKIVADNLTLPVWDGCSETVKREIVKTHHAEALQLNAALDAPFCPVTECNECATPCTADLQRAGLIAENNLRTAVQHD